MTPQELTVPGINYIKIGFKPTHINEALLVIAGLHLLIFDFNALRCWDATHDLIGQERERQTLNPNSPLTHQIRRC